MMLGLAMLLAVALGIRFVPAVRSIFLKESHDFKDAAGLVDLVAAVSGILLVTTLVR